MTEGQIWGIMCRLKAFTTWMVLKELNPPQYLRGYTREKIKSLIKSQIRWKTLTILNESPRVYGLPGASLERVMRECKNCGRAFIPKSENHKYCSRECREKGKKRNEQTGATRRRYEEWEEALIWETLSKHGCKTAILQELAKRLNRHPQAIKSKFKKMRVEGGRQHDRKADFEKDR